MIINYYCTCQFKFFQTSLNLNIEIFLASWLKFLHFVSIGWHIHNDECFKIIALYLKCCYKPKHTFFRLSLLKEFFGEKRERYKLMTIIYFIHKSKFIPMVILRAFVSGIFVITRPQYVTSAKSVFLLHKA